MGLYDEYDNEYDEQQPSRTQNLQNITQDVYDIGKKINSNTAASNAANNAAVSTGAASNTAAKGTVAGSAGAAGAGASAVGAGGSAASASATTASAAATTGGATIGLPILIVTVIVLLIVLFIIFFAGLFTIMSPRNIVASINNGIESKRNNLFETFTNFINNFFDDTEWLIADESAYDSRNEADVSYIEEFNLINTALNKAYDEYVLEEIEAYCTANNYDLDKSLEYVSYTYPNGYDSVYKDLNYGEFISLLSYGYANNAYGDMASTSYDSLKDFLLSESTWPYLYHITYTETTVYINESDAKHDAKSEKNNSNTGKNNSNSNGKSNSSSNGKTVTYVCPTIHPYCISDIFEMLNLDKDEPYYDTGISFYDMLELMITQIKVECSDSSGAPRTIYYTLNLDAQMSDWYREYSSSSANDILASDISIDVSLGNNETIVYHALIDAGFTEEGACGLMGNIYAEHHFSTAITPGDQGSIGLCQWRLGRAEALKNYAATNGLALESIEAQCGYLIYELPSQCSGHYDTIKNASDVTFACDYVAKYFERCAYCQTYNTYLSRYSAYSWNRFVWSDACQVYIIDLSTRRSAARKYYEIFAGTYAPGGN